MLRGSPPTISQHFADLTFQLLAEHILPAHVCKNVYIEDDLTAFKLGVPKLDPGKEYHLYCSIYNQGAEQLVNDALAVCGQTSRGVRVCTDPAQISKCSKFFLYLDGCTWSSGESRTRQLTEEVEQAMDAGIPLSLAHEVPMFDFPGSSWDQIQPMGGSGELRARNACDFAIFFAKTPECLLTRNIYNNIAIPLKGGGWRAVSLKMFGKQLSDEADTPQMAQLQRRDSLIRKLERRDTRCRSCRTLDRCTSNGQSLSSTPSASVILTVAKLTSSPLTAAKQLTSPLRVMPPGEASPAVNHRSWGKVFTPLRSAKRLRTPELEARRQSLRPPVRLRGMKTFTRLVSPRRLVSHRTQRSGGEVPPSAHAAFTGVEEASHSDAATGALPRASLATELCVHSGASTPMDGCTQRDTPGSIERCSRTSPSPVRSLPRSTTAPVPPHMLAMAGQQRVQAALLSAQQHSPNLVPPRAVPTAAAPEVWTLWS